MDRPTPAMLDRTARQHDPLAIAVANASLLGAGYAMLGRRALAIGAASATVALAAILATVARSTWLEIVVLAWWVTVIVHGWYLASSSPAATLGDGHVDKAGRQRLLALVVTIPVLLAFGLLRFDAARLENKASEAHREGDCSRAVPALQGLWAGHRVADAPLTARADDSIEACELLLKADRQAGDDRLSAVKTLETYRAHPGALWEGAMGQQVHLYLAQATDELDTALTGDTHALAAGFGHLSTVLGRFPGREDDAGRVLDAFLGSLPVDDACGTKAITDWLDGRGQSADGGDVLDRANDVIPRVAPAATVGCGDELMAADQWKRARALYQQLLDQYPGHDLAGKAKRGIKNANLAIQLAKVRHLLRTASPARKPAYCNRPAPYGGAKPYRSPGAHPALLFGNDELKKGLPPAWLARDAADAVLVVCAGETKFGAPVQTCAYESGRAIGGYQNVTFRKKRIPFRVYELRTGKLVANTAVEIGGAGCPHFIHYTYYGGFDPGPPSEKYVGTSPQDVRAAYESVINP